MIPNTLTRTLPRLAGAALAGLLLTANTADAATLVRAHSSGKLTDLQLATAEPTDGAAAIVIATERGTSTTVTLKLRGLDRTIAGTTLGAHVHVGNCVEGDGAAAGAHYNSTGGTTISDQTEVWLDFTVKANGTAKATAKVPFIIPADGAGAVVIHAMETNEITGAAGARLACLPVNF